MDDTTFTPPLLEDTPLPTMIDLYRRDIRHLVSLTDEEQLAYLRWQTPALKQRFIETYLRMPVVSAWKLCVQQPKMEPYLMDFIQAGNEGLLLAIDRATNFQRVKDFVVYATKYVNGYIYKQLEYIPTIHVPAVTLWAHRKAGDSQWMGALRETSSLDQLKEDFDFDMVATERELRDELKDEEKRQRLETLLLSLPEKESRVVRMRYGIGQEPLTVQEIAHHLGRKDGQIVKWHQQALNHMKGRIVSVDLLTREREARMQEVLDVWKEQGIKVRISPFGRSADCDHRTAKKFLLKQGVISEQK